MEDDVQELNEATQRRRVEIEDGVLNLVRGLATELNPRRKVQVGVKSALQRDLGLDSLGLSELLLRTEKQFKVRLPDDLFGRLETPSDLIAEILKAGEINSSSILQSSDLLPGEAVEAVPLKAATLIEALQWQVDHNGDRPHILLSDGYRETDTISYRALSEAAGKLAANMRSWGLEPGEFVGIMLPTGREFFEAFFGTLLAGAVPVPMYPPARLSQLEEHLRRQAGILRNSGAALLIIPKEGKVLATLLAGQIETLRGVSTVGDLHLSNLPGISIRRESDQLAMLQYTSGSTGDPKGVMLSHANLLANIRAMGDAIDASSSDIFVSWLPLYHDLGLIGAWLGSLYYAVPVVIMSPLRFITRPESWLWAIHRNAATLTAAPNFAFELCANKVDDEVIEGLDLSSLRMVANGAEPVSAATIQKFTERFQPFGFRPEAMTPVYGLAENAVGLAFSEINERPIIERISRKSLPRTAMAVPAGEGDEHPMSLVSSGVPLPGNEVRIVDEIGREVPERQQGRLEFRGPSSTAGYYRDARRTKSLIQDGWWDSSDLAYIAGGNIFITGRMKDIIIKGGRNIYPHEIEEAVGDVNGIRKGCVAAFPTEDRNTGTERLIVVAETRSTDAAERERLEQEVSQTVTDVLGVPADEVLIVPPHIVPKTSSGKIRRSALREQYENQQLGRPARALWLQVLRLGLLSGVPRIRRLFGTIADLAYAAWWWLVLVLLASVTWLFVLLLPSKRLRWKFVRSAAALTLRLMRVPLSVTGRERLALDTGVLAVNHSSYFDVVALAAVLPGEPVFIAKQELSNQYVAGPFLRRLGAQFVDRAFAQAAAEEVETYKTLVRGGQQLVVFPEATFFRMPGLLRFRLGAFAIAGATQTLVLPIAMTGTRSILRAGQWFPRRGPVKVEVLPPVVPDGEDFNAAVKLRDRVRADILAHCGEPDLADKEVVFSEPEDEPAKS